MSRPSTFTAALASSNQIKIYNAMTGNLHRIITLPGSSALIAGPVVLSDGLSVTVKEGSGTFLILYSFPLCNIKSKTHISTP